MCAKRRAWLLWYVCGCFYCLQGVQQKRPSAAQNAILRRYFLELTQSFIIPLVMLNSTLMDFNVIVVENIDSAKVVVSVVFWLWFIYLMYVYRWGLKSELICRCVYVFVCVRSGTWPVWCLCRSPSVPGRVPPNFTLLFSRTLWRRWRKLVLSLHPDWRETGSASTGGSPNLSHCSHSKDQGSATKAIKYPKITGRKGLTSMLLLVQPHEGTLFSLFRLFCQNSRGWSLQATTWRIVLKVLFSLQRHFLKSPNFDGWFRTRRREMIHKLEALHLEALCEEVPDSPVWLWPCCTSGSLEVSLVCVFAGPAAKSPEAFWGGDSGSGPQAQG